MTVISAYVQDWTTCPTCQTCESCGSSPCQRKCCPDCSHYGNAQRCPDCVDGMVPSPELVERSRLPVLDSIAMIASKWLGIAHEEAMDRADIQEAATVITKAVLLASRKPR